MLKRLENCHFTPTFHVTNQVEVTLLVAIFYFLVFYVELSRKNLVFD